MPQLLVITGMILVGASVAAPPNTKTGGWSLPEIRAAVDATRARIRSIHFEAEVLGRVAVTPAGEYRRRYVVYAAKGDCRFFDMGHVHDPYGWKEDLQRSQQFICPGRIDVFFPLHRVAEGSVREADPAVNAKLRRIYHEFYLENTGWWPPGADPKRSQLVPEDALHRVLRLADCRVLPQTEVVNGFTCVVLRLSEPDRTLWLDMQRGGTLLRRKLQVSEEESSWALYENSDHQEVAPGAWLPRLARRRVYRGDFDVDADIPETAIWSDTRYFLKRLDVNDVDEELFRFQPPPGTLIYDVDADRYRFRPGGLEMTDRVAQLSTKILQQNDRAARNSWRPGEGVLLGVLLAALPPWVLTGIRRLRRRHAIMTSAAPVSFETGSPEPD